MNKTSQKKTRQDRTKQDQTRQDKTGQNKTRQESSRQDSRRQDKTRQDKTRRNKERHLRQAGPCLALFVLFVSWALPCHRVHVHIFSTKAAIVTFGTFRSVLPLQVFRKVPLALRGFPHGVPFRGSTRGESVRGGSRVKFQC